jgi:peptidoglycan/LPS O-acetylase OafA/YrhL
MSNSINNKDYRWDIQGLRAIAVLAVVVFHISPKYLPGGFIGVDVFFVISGYLILGFIWRDLINKQFNLLRFYKRRALRLLPPFLVMAIVTSIITYFILLPEELIQYAKSLLATLMYASNFYFHSQSDYFGPDLAHAPLLHTWSLSVEEQFYLLFPCILFIVYYCSNHSDKHQKSQSSNIIITLSIIGLFSYSLSQYLINTNNAMLSFFASPSRFWQFIIGGLLALSPSIFFLQKRMPLVIAELLSFLGLMGITFCLFFYNEQVDFPGFNAILPTLSTTLIIFSSSKTRFFAWLLSCKPAKFFGNTSYSLYLWHWPILLFFQLKVVSTSYTSLFILLISIVCGYLSWRYIERYSYSFKFTFKASMVAYALLFITAVFYLSGLPSRYTPTQLHYSSFIDYDRKDYYRQGRCFLTSEYNSVDFFDHELCIDFDKNKENTLLIGDSHAAQWYGALNANKGQQATVSQVNASGCKPVLLSQGAKRCTELMQWGLNALTAEYNFTRIILAARWNIDDLPALIQTIKQLENATTEVVVFGPIIEYDFPLPRLLASYQTRLEISDFNHYLTIKNIDSAFSKAIKETSAQYISVLDTICKSNTTCSLTTDANIPLQYDYGHLTFEGANQMLLRIKKTN